MIAIPIISNYYFNNMFTNRIIKFLKTNKYPFATTPAMAWFTYVDDDDTNETKPNEITLESSKLTSTLHKIDGHDINTLTQEICNKLVDDNPENIGKIPGKFVTNKMCHNIIDINPNNIRFIPYQYIKNDMCVKVFDMHVNFYFWIPEWYRTKEMYDKVVTYHKNLLKNDQRHFKNIPKEIINDEFIIYAVEITKGEVSFDDITKYKVTPQTQLKLNRFCKGITANRLYSYTYCATLLDNLKPQFAKHE